MGQGYRGTARDAAEDEASVVDRFDDDSAAREYTQSLLNQLDAVSTPAGPGPDPVPPPGEEAPGGSTPGPADLPEPPEETPTSYEEYLQNTGGGEDTPEVLWDARSHPEQPPNPPSRTTGIPDVDENRAVDPEHLDWEDPLTSADPDPTEGQALGDIASFEGSDIHGITNDGQILVDPQGSRGGITDSTMDADASDGIRGELGHESNFVAAGDTTELNSDLTPDGRAVTAGMVDTVATDYDPDVVLDTYQDYLESELDTTPTTDPAALEDVKAQNGTLDSRLLDEEGTQLREMTREEADRLFADRHRALIGEGASPWSGRSSLEGNEHKLGEAKADAAYNQSLRDRGLLPDPEASDADIKATAEYASEYVTSLREDLTDGFEPQDSPGTRIPDEDYPFGAGQKKTIEVPTDDGTKEISIPDWSHLEDGHCGSIRTAKPHPYDGQAAPNDWLVQWQGERMPKDPNDGVDSYVSEEEATNYLLDMDEDRRANVRGRALGMAQRDGAPDTKNIELKIAAAAKRRGDIVSGVEYVRDHLQHYGPSTTPIDDLDDLAARGMTNASVEAKVQRTKAPSNPTTQHQYFELQEKKNGKLLQVFSWKKSDPDTEVREGDTVVIRNAELQEYNGRAQLSTRSYTDIAITDRENPDAPSRAAPEFDGFTPKDANRNAIGAETDHTDAVPLENSAPESASRSASVDWSGLFGEDGMLVDHTMERSGEGERMVRRRDHTTGQEVDVGELREFESRTFQTDKGLVIHTGENFDQQPTMTTQCPGCDNNQAYFYQQTTRKADEGETEFCTCTECHTKWRQ